MNIEKILIIDFGSQYTQLIARRIRELHVYSEIVSPTKSLIIKDKNIKGIILSGGPQSVYDKNSPDLSKKFFETDIPILGICYGMQLIAHKFGGKVEKSKKREFGKALLKHNKNILFNNVKQNSIVWMSHSDKVVKSPKGFSKIGYSENTEYGAIFNKNRKIYGIQFHPEVVHTEKGHVILKNFVKKVCKIKSNWTPENFINKTINDIREQAKEGTIISGISGGVDSTVASELVHRAVGNRLKGFIIDTGLLRYNEGKDTVKLLNEKLNLKVKYVNRSNLFLSKLKNISSPERKRKIIGKVFIQIFEEQAKSFKNAKYLVQGTIYPDRIESKSTGGPSATIKSHHNVGGLPKRMKLSLIEPLTELFKDEVREVGKALGIPDELLQRHPFPGPGLAVRIIGDIRKDRVKILQLADKIFIDTIRKYNVYDDIWQAFAVFLPIKTVGVMGDYRTYENVIALRAVNSVDGMTADWYNFPKEILHEASTRIINEIKGVNRVVYDISTKPPATIEWE